MCSSAAPTTAAADDLNSGGDWDDALHDPDDSKYRRGGISSRGFWNILTVVLIALLILGLFLVWPLIEYATNNTARQLVANNIQVNSTGQIPKTPKAPSRSVAFTARVFLPCTNALLC